jgi:hypothetical protein
MMTGDPNVMNDVYMKNNRILEVAIPNFSPS